MSLKICVAILLATVAVEVASNRVYFGWPADGNKSYFYETGTVRNYHQAKMFCESQNSTLVQIKSADEQRILDKHVPNVANRYWIGVETSSRTLPTKFLDGTEITWYNWSPSEPRGEFDCRAIYIWQQTRKWIMNSCDVEVTITVCEQQNGFQLATRAKLRVILNGY